VDSKEKDGQLYEKDKIIFFPNYLKEAKTKVAT
jgi:hypothetical protein